MVAVKLSAFGGMIPIQDDTLLPQPNAVLSRNTFLDSGALQGMKQTRLLHTMVNPGFKYAFRFPLTQPDKNHIFNSFWWEFLDPDTNVLRSPTSNDGFERYYFMSPSQPPGFNTKARILNGDPSFLTGIPNPVNPPTVVVTGGSGITTTRAYLYTWVDAYGAEGPPSPAEIATGFMNGTWTVTVNAPTPIDMANRNLTKTRIYRTVTNSSGGAAYFQVVELPIATLIYDDTLTDSFVAANPILPSQSWFGPPADLKGMVSMPNGIIAAWRANEIWFCEPFRPHAWPSEYTLTVDADIVGLGVVGQTLMVLTEGYPYSCSGIHPSNMTLAKVSTFEPCMSRPSIISTANGVFYASPNGICLAAYGAVQNATVSLASKDHYQELIRPETLRAARLSASYFAFGSAFYGAFEPTAFQNDAFSIPDEETKKDGVLINFGDSRVAWTQLLSPIDVANVMTDIWSGEIFIVRNNTVMWQDITKDAYDGVYLWRSKLFQLQEITNLGAMKIWFNPNVNDPAFTHSSIRNTSEPQTLQPNQYGLVRVYCDGNLIHTRELWKTGELMRLPNGFKSQFWQFEIEARVNVSSMEVASSPKELSGI